jgi:hypothetical protein
MINHPLAFGRIRLASPVLYTVATPQRIKVESIRIKNLDPLDRTVTLSLFARGTTIELTPGINSVTLPSGYTLELITIELPIILDQGAVILGVADKDAVIEYLIDGKEDFTMET